MTTTVASAPTHPRISERRAAVRDQKLRSRNRKLSIAGLLVLAGLIAAAATQSPLLDVDEIRVIGAERNSAELSMRLRCTGPCCQLVTLLGTTRSQPDNPPINAG